MSRRPPPTDGRRASALRALLLDIMPSVSPDWYGPGRDDTFGRALVEIAARMGEETTRRLDLTARRDRVAFFDALDIAPAQPRAATGIAVFQLADERETPVFARRRLGLSAAVEDGGEEVAFETESALQLTPARLIDLVAAAPVDDRLERGPGPVLAVARPETAAGNHRLVGFVDVGSTIIQVNPVQGIAPGDLLRIGGPVHRVERVDDDLITLREPIEVAADAGTAIEKLTSFPSFDVRDLQQHVFHLGHADLLNLEQPARIELCLTPASTAQRLADLDIAYELWGTVEDDDEPAWHELEQVGTSGPVITLAKLWTGSVDEREVDERSNRWLRARLVQPLTGPDPVTIRASQLELRVESLATEDDRDETTGLRPEAEGTRTVAAAFHNGSPLAVGGRFLPFGAEPRRFDTFSLSAPEAFSKKGALVEVAFNIVDASLGAVAVPVAGSNRSYGVAANGRLQLLTFGDDDVQWDELNAPTVPETGNELLLDPAIILAAPGSASHDLVVAADRRGGWWSTLINPADAVSGDGPEWFAIATPAVADEEPELSLDQFTLSRVIRTEPGPSILRRGETVLVGVAGGELQLLAVTGQAEANQWRTVGIPGSDRGSSVLNLGRPARAVAVAGDPAAFDPDINLILVLESGQVWHLAVSPNDLKADPARIDIDPPVPAAVDQGNRLADFSVTPAATFFSVRGQEAAPKLWVAWARQDDRSMTGYSRIGAGPFERFTPDPPFMVEEGGTILAQSRDVDDDQDHPVTVAAGAVDQRSVVVVWDRETELIAPPAATVDRPGAVATLLTTTPNGTTRVVIAGRAEKVYAAAITEPETSVEVVLHDKLTWNTAAFNGAEHVVFHDPAAPVPAEQDEAITGLPLDGRLRIEDGGRRIYQIEPDAVVEGTRYRFLVTSGQRFGGAIPGFTVSSGRRDIEMVERTRLALDDGDTETQALDYLLIGAQYHHVTRLVDENGGSRVATLSPELSSGPGTSIRYQSLRPQDADGVTRVSAADLGTLVSLSGRSTPPSPAAGLSFAPPAQPAVREITATAADVGRAWVLLDSPWITRPNRTVRATLTDTATIIEGWTPFGPDRVGGNPELAWEYHDEDGWRLLPDDLTDSTADLLRSGSISFRVPRTIAPTTVGGRTDLFVRARLVGGDYGQTVPKVRIEIDPETGESTQIVQFDRTGLRPPEIAAIEAEFRQAALEPVESLLVTNNLTTIDQTQAAQVKTARFDLLINAAAIDPTTSGRALYLGFDKPIAVNPLRLHVDADEQPGRGPITTDVLTATGWREATTIDETEGLRRIGLVTIAINDDATRTNLFGNEGYWLRLRPDHSIDDPAAEDWAPELRGLYPNAVAISQAVTVGPEIVGTSLGEPSLTVELAQAPVLPDSLELRIREPLSADEIAAVERERSLPTGLAATSAGGATTGFDDTSAGPSTEVSITIDNAPGNWVLWQRVDSFAGHDGEARVFRLDAGRGRISFGDGRQGKIPPPGRDAIRAITYQQGRGFEGNVPAWTELSVVSSLESIDLVALPVDAAGGVDAPGTEAAFEAAPERLRHAGQALTPADLEALAVAFSPSIVNACCFFPGGPGEPIRVVIAQRTGERCPQPTAAVRDALQRRLLAAGWGGLSEDRTDPDLVIGGPTYVPVAVTVSVTAPADLIGQVEREATEALNDFLHPIDGGPTGTGWPFGRRVWPSDVLRVLESIDGIERVLSFDLTVTPPTGDCVPDRVREQAEMPPDGLICALPDDIDVRVEPRQEGS